MTLPGYRLDIASSFADDLKRYEALLAEHMPPERAAAVARDIIHACNRLVAAPLRGTDWRAVRPGLRSVPALGRGTIIFEVEDRLGRVLVLGWLWRGARIKPVVDRFQNP